MAKSKESFNRRERERMKRQKADAKRERRLTSEEPGEGSEGNAPAPVQVQVDEGAIIQQLAELNATFEMGDLGFEDFDKRRSQLLSQLAVV